jgi:hypothetical protein
MLSEDEKTARILAIAHIMAGYAQWVAAGYARDGEGAVQAAAEVCLDAAKLCADIGQPVSWDDIGAHWQEIHPLTRLAQALDDLEDGFVLRAELILSIAEHLRSFYRDYPSSYKLLYAASQAELSHELTDAVIELYEERRNGDTANPSGNLVA